MLANAAPQLTTLASNPLDIKPRISGGSSAIPSSTQSTPALNPADYPAVQFWNKSEWKKHIKSLKDTTTVNQKAAKKGGTRAAGGENVAMQFVEDAKGRMIDGHRAGEIRKHARSNFNDIAKWTTPPSTWGSASSVMRSYYHQQMYFRFPEVQYCDLDWKAEKIASEAYTHWNRPETTTVKLEADTASRPATRTKHPRSPSTVSTQLKKQKKVTIQHDPSLPAPTTSTSTLPSSRPSVSEASLASIPLAMDPSSKNIEPANSPLPPAITVVTDDNELTSPQRKSSHPLGQGIELGQSVIMEAEDVGEVELAAPELGVSDVVPVKVNIIQVFLVFVIDPSHSLQLCLIHCTCLFCIVIPLANIIIGRISLGHLPHVQALAYLH